MKITYYQDPGHGWIKVPGELLYSLGIAQDISSYSYMAGVYAYLEEDCDAAKFVEAAKERGIAFEIVSKHSNNESAIRKYARYNAAAMRSALINGKLEVGDVLVYGGVSYELVRDLGPKGWEVKIPGGKHYQMSHARIKASYIGGNPL